MNPLFFAGTTILLLMMSCHPGPRPEDAVRFNDNLVMMQDTFYNHLDEVVLLINSETPSAHVAKKYEELLKYTDQALQRIELMSPFDEEDEIRIASIEYFRAQLHMLENEFRAIMDLLQADPAEITTEDQNAWDSLMNVVVIRDSVAIDNFLMQQEVFAKKYNIILREID